MGDTDLAMVWMLWILWAGVLLGGLCGVRAALKGSRRYEWLALVAVAVLALGLRVDWRGETFYGLEYEDAYVYAVASRSLTPTTLAWDPGGKGRTPPDSRASLSIHVSNSPT